MSHLDDTYRERAALVAWLAYIYPSAMAPSTDIDEEGWWTVYVYAGGQQLTWHIAPGDLDLYGHVIKTSHTDPYVRWDGHTTEEKYQRIRNYITNSR